MESMLVDQHMRAPGLRPFDLEMASANLTMEEKALLQARIQLLGLRTPFPTSGPVSPHAMSPHLASTMNHLNSMGMHGGGFPHFGPVPAGSPPANHGAAAAARISEAAAAAAAANALNINGSLSQLYAMAAASASPGANSPGSRGHGAMPTAGGNAGGGSVSPGGGQPQVPLPIQLWSQWASLHGLGPLAPTLLAHHAQLAAAMAAASSSTSANTSPNHLSGLHHPNGPSGMPPGRPLSNGSCGAPPGNMGPSNDPTMPRLPRPMYPITSSGGGGPTSSSPISGMHRYSPYTIPMNNSASRSHHLSGGGGGGGSVGSLGSNKSPSPIGSPDSLRDEVLS